MSVLNSSQCPFIAEEYFEKFT